MPQGAVQYRRHKTHITLQHTKNILDPSFTSGSRPEPIPHLLHSAGSVDPLGQDRKIKMPLRRTLKINIDI